MAEAVKRIDRRRAPETAERILDAAESLFSVRGFYGVSLRDIAMMAEVPMALTHYHFGTKDDLFRAVIERRAEVHAFGIADSLRAAQSVSGTRSEQREAIIRAFIMPIVERSMRGGAGWKNYIRLLSLIANTPQDEAFVAPFSNHYDSVISQYIDALKEVDPEMKDENIRWSFFFFQATITHILVESGMLDRQSQGALHSRDLDAIMDRLVPFISAGFTGLGAED